jgi:hypothetical protein
MGSAVVDEVAHRLGQRIWPEPYDVAAIEGLARLREEVEGKEWAELDAASRAAKVFYEIEKRHGRRILVSAFKKSLSESPSGKELMDLFVRSLRELTNDPNAGNWIPREVLVPEIKWNVKERKVDENFFAEVSPSPTRRESTSNMGMAHPRDTGALPGRVTRFFSEGPRGNGSSTASTSSVRGMARRSPPTRISRYTSAMRISNS